MTLHLKQNYYQDFMQQDYFVKFLNQQQKDLKF